MSRNNLNVFSNISRRNFNVMISKIFTVIYIFKIIYKEYRLCLSKTFLLNNYLGCVLCDDNILYVTLLSGSDIKSKSTNCDHV